MNQEKDQEIIDYLLENLRQAKDDIFNYTQRSPCDAHEKILDKAWKDFRRLSILIDYLESRINHFKG